MSEGRRERRRRVLALLVGLFPPRFRRDLGDDLLRTCEAQLGDAEREGLAARVRFWVVTPPVLLRDAVLEWVTTGRASRVRRAAPAAGVRRMLGEPVRHVRTTLRMFAREPSFAALVVGTLALGIGTSTSIFSVFDGVLLRPLPYPSPEQLYQVGVNFGPAEFEVTSIPNIHEMRTDIGDLWLAAGRVDDRVLVRDGRPRGIEVAAATHDFMALLGGAPALGRFFDPDDENAGATPVAILSHRFWTREFSADPDVLGSELRLDGTTFTVVGVAPATLHEPEVLFGPVDAWLPAQHSLEDATDRGEFSFSMLVRAPAGTSVERIRAQLGAAADRVARAYPDDNTLNGHRMGVWVRDLHSQTTGRASGGLGLLMGAVGLLLLITCANVAGLFLARSLDREREFAVRSALGAGRGRLIREQLGQGLVTALVAGAIGGLVAVVGVRLFKALSPGDLPRIAEVAVDWRVFGFALVVSAGAGVLSTLVPALRAGRGRCDVHVGTRASEQRGTVAVRSGLVIVETALAVVLLVGSGLLLNSLLRLDRVDAGFDSAGLLAVELNLETLHRAEDQLDALHRELVRSVQAVPGIDAVTSGTNYPLNPHGGTWTRLAMDGHTYDNDAPRPFVRVNAVGDDYLGTLRARLIAGRDFLPADRDPAGGVVVNQAFVEAYWPGESGVGRTVKFGQPDAALPWLPVVGVVQGVRQRGLATSPEPEVFIPYSRRPRVDVALLARTSVGVGAIAEPIRRAIWSVEPALPVDRIVRMDDQRSSTAAEPWFHALLMTLFAALAVLLAAVGLYGSLAYAVSRRTRELGIRMALGAARPQLLADVVGRGMTLALTGVAVGIVASLAVTRVLESALYGVRPNDPATLIFAAVTLSAVAALACYLPARRAAATDPTESLRSD